MTAEVAFVVRKSNAQGAEKLGIRRLARQRVRVFGRNLKSKGREAVATKICGVGGKPTPDHH